jgi:hypothetical protein
MVANPQTSVALAGVAAVRGGGLQAQMAVQVLKTMEKAAMGVRLEPLQHIVVLEVAEWVGMALPMDQALQLPPMDGAVCLLLNS